ncbi:MAG: hypothetical protein KVP17_002023 [Porospora cf. gigantea B]|uniref:uncharacterized protein n=1 Tax=Porospora cf. gigantea B TaxID=2853592 RepID=UPI003571BDD7|nr:MAG: hypothetical protein KVP17_002023 [Porospora cf. gigantea B]
MYYWLPGDMLYLRRPEPVWATLKQGHAEPATRVELPVTEDQPQKRSKFWKTVRKLTVMETVKKVYTAPVPEPLTPIAAMHAREAAKKAIVGYYRKNEAYKRIQNIIKLGDTQEKRVLSANPEYKILRASQQQKVPDFRARRDPPSRQAPSGPSPKKQTRS